MTSEYRSNPVDALYQSSLTFMQNYLQAYELLKKADSVTTPWQEMFNINHIFQKWLDEVKQEPPQLWEAYHQWLQDCTQLGNQVQAMLGGQKVSPLVQPAQNDRRFKAADWQENPTFFFLAQSYLLLVQHCLKFIEQHPSQDPKLNRQISFFTRQYLDALAPTNFIWSNPQVLRQTLSTQGENLTKGAENLLQDILNGQGYWQIKMTDLAAFAVGKNIATTKGKIIFQNRLIQLIQYEPTTQKVYQRPLLIIPPWINKYYILDLREHNSLVKWAIDQGLTVFMISWVNPDESLRDLSLQDYLFEGLFPALTAVHEATGEPDVNVLGFCIGGTLLAMALAYMKAKNDQRIKSATFLATLIDFYDPGEIEVFIDEEQISSIEQKIAPCGYLDGRLLMMTFNLLRANDLLWPYYVNNYLNGQDPFAFDILFWNSDSTNLPAKMFSEYVRHLYLENRLCHPKSLQIGDVALDLSQVTTPAYFLSTELDHIAPWQTVFSGAQNLQGPLTFVLAGSGHIAGIVNPPCNNKYSYRYSQSDPKAFKNGPAWLESTAVVPGSWWEHWVAWLKPYAGELVVARTWEQRGGTMLQDAPGDYVKKQCF